MKQNNGGLTSDEVLCDREESRNNEAISPEDRLIRIGEVMGMIGLKKSALYARIKIGTFPAPYNLGGNSVGWRRNEILGWINGLARTK